MSGETTPVPVVMKPPPSPPVPPLGLIVPVDPPVPLLVDWVVELPALHASEALNGAAQTAQRSASVIPQRG
ncbi:MAG: hypothetical protein ABI134_01350, partial [Byssovorax sp.]